MQLAVQLLLNGAVLGSIYGLMSGGFALIFGAARHFHISHAAVFASAGYLAYLFSSAGVPLVLSVLIGIAFGVLLGMVLVRFLYTPLERRGGEGFILFLVSLGVLMIVDNIFTIGLGARPARLDLGGWFREPLSLGPWSITVGQAVFVLITLVLVGALLVVLNVTPAGKLIRAYSGNPELVQVIGRNPTRVVVLVYAVGSLFAAVAGIYVAGDTGMQPGRGETIFLISVMAMFVGGIGSVAGAFVAGMLLGIFQNLLLLVMNSEWTLAAVFVAFLIVMTASPQGLSALKFLSKRRLA